MNYEYTTKQLAHFWNKVNINDDDECWDWIGSKCQGYGHIGMFGKMLYAHRISYQLAYGSYSDELDILHTCDNPCCVNPNHLFSGTHNDNMQDRKRKGRYVGLKGDKNPKCKIPNSEVATIRLRYANENISMRELARIYHVTRPTIGRIVNMKRD